MKLLLPMFGSVIAALSMNAQAVNDTVSIGSGYANQVWYSLESGELTASAKDEWDLAFEVNGIASSIRLNGVTGNALYEYPGDTSDWNNVDTSGLAASWPQVYNSDTSWAMGAFNVNADPADAFDLGWGMYNLTTHQVRGNRIYILNHLGSSFKKLWIESLASGTYTFRLANLDGSNELIRTVVKGDFPDKNFGYYSISSDQTINREPITSNWQLLFSQYPAIIPGFGGYPSTGILQNRNVNAAKVYPVDDVDAFEDHTSATFSTEINTIGYDWKSYNFGTNGWDIADSTVYLVQDQNGVIWKLIVKDFGGSANGNYIFSKEKLHEPIDTATGMAGLQEAAMFMQLYPNPALDGMVTLACDVDASETTLQIVDINGSVVHQQVLASARFQTHYLNLQHLAKGLYFVQMSANGTVQSRKLILQ